MLSISSLSPTALSYRGLNHAELDGTVLATIVNARLEDLEELPEASGTRSAPYVSLRQALRGPQRHLILELKSASPTLGDINTALNLRRSVEVYSEFGAAISVLCESRYFKGSFERLKQVKELTDLPVIAKDFVISRKQIKSAYVAGADAILLMCSVLDRPALLDFTAYANSLGLEVILEVTTRSEAEFALENNYPVIGINNRDLKTLQVDFTTARELEGLLLNAGRIVISESGIKSVSDLLSLAPFNNFLVGSSICREADPYRAVLSLRYGYNKICGLKDEAALKAAIDGKATLAGFIFHKKSPRYISPADAKALIESTGAKRFLYTVGVFLDHELPYVVKTCADLKLDYAQLHGHESPDYIRALKAALPALKIIKAFNIRSPQSFMTLQDYAGLCELLLLDSSMPGSGTSFNWEDIPAELDRSRCLLSGGLNAHNAAKALSLGFAGLDVNSGVESAPGVKDPLLITQLLTQLRQGVTHEHAA